MDNLFEQMANISKAHAYDILSKQNGELKELVKELTNKVCHVRDAYGDLMTETICTEIDTIVKKAKILSL